MIQERNNFNGGLDLDSSPLHVDRTHYVDALNITRDAIGGNADMVITNVVGNRIVSYGSYPFGGAGGKYIGLFANTLRNTVIGLRYQINGYHGIYELNKTTRTITKIFQNLTDSGGVDVLGFTANGKITSVNIFNRDEGDLLFFLDSLGRPTKIDVALFKAGTYTPVTRNILDVAVDWPSIPVTGVYVNDSTKNSNNLTNKRFKFQQINVFDDFTESCGSPESASPIPSNILNPIFTNVITNNNLINLTLNSGGKNVKAVKLLMSYSEKSNSWTDFFLVDTIDKSKQSISDDVAFNYSFYNDSTYPLFDVERRIQLFDFVPLYANAQEMPNGNTLVYGGITEGYNNTLVSNVAITVNTIAVGNGGVVGNLTETHTLGTVGGFQLLTEIFAGSPSTGTVITIKGNGDAITIATYTTVAGDTTQQVVNGLQTSANSLGFVLANAGSSTTITFWFIHPAYFYSSTTITAPAVAADFNSVCTWPFLSQRKIGIVYFDQKGRTNGVVYNSQVIFPAYNENGSHQVLVPYINAKIYHQPPDWAYSFSWVITHDDSNYLYFVCTSVNTSETDFIYFDITNLGLTQTKNPTVSNVVAWTFQAGDRLRLIRQMSNGSIFGTTYDAAVEGIVTSPRINNIVQTDKTFIKIKKFAPFSTQNYSTNFFVFQLYRPAQPQASTQNLPFFEFGETYPILNPTTSTRIHAGSVTNQTTDYVTPAEFNFYNGDSYVRPRTVYISDTPSVNTSTFYVQDRNFVDFYISAVNSLDGRPNAIDPNARQAYYPTFVRFSLEYDPDTNVNMTNRFLSANFDQYDYSYGDIQRFKSRDRFMRVFQKLKTGVVQLFSKIGKSPSGDQITIETDKLLNPIQYYSGDYGIGDAKESLASFNFADYFCDTNRGVICRVSLDGAQVISVLYKMDSWAVEQIPLRVGNYKIYGSFDQKLNNYIIALEAVPNYGTNPSCISYRLTNDNLTSKGYSYTDCAGVSQSGTLGAGQTITFCAIFGTISAVDMSPQTVGQCLPTILYPAYTLAFAEHSQEELNSFESFLSFYPEMMCTVGTLLVSAYGGEIYTHDSILYNTFYGTTYDSTITFVFNDSPYQKKTWISVNEIASGVWDCPSIQTNAYSYGATPQQTNLIAQEFDVLEGNPSSSIKCDANSPGGKHNGYNMKGNYAIIKFRKSLPISLVDLSMITCKSIISQLNTV